MHNARALGIVAVAAWTLLPSALAAQASKASGTLTVDATQITLAHAVRVTTPNVFNDQALDSIIVLSDRPLSAVEAADEDLLLARARRGELTSVAVRFDERRGRRLFNVTIRHAALAEPVLLPDVLFKWTFKDGAGTLVLDSREFSSHTYAAHAEYFVPVPQETSDAGTGRGARLPPPSRTDADRKAATQLLIETLQEGDETRALAIVKLGIDPNGRDARMDIPLINWAVLMCQPLIVEALVALKADLHHQRLPGMTLLSEATAACPEAVPFLKAGGAK